MDGTDDAERLAPRRPPPGRPQVAPTRCVGHVSTSQVRAVESMLQRALGALLQGGCVRWATGASKAPSESTKSSAPAYAGTEDSLPPKLHMPGSP
jgi:hypothetical protein